VLNPIMMTALATVNASRSRSPHRAHLARQRRQGASQGKSNTKTSLQNQRSQSSEAQAQLAKKPNQ